ncbi:hypothetical protein RJT34_16460 [Clitoria ternatea]|uniref:Uncharacterized protein n=1 Tax=Clitoria ternatea TaxID=43366 RepID=A0AAN9J8I2_CLITE
MWKPMHNGGGMDPNKMRQCMPLGYSVKSKLANTVGQCGNGFKTSAMRLGADVIVFSRYRGKDGKRVPIVGLFTQFTISLECNVAIAVMK